MFQKIIIDICPIYVQNSAIGKPKLELEQFVSSCLSFLFWYEQKRYCLSGVDVCVIQRRDIDILRQVALI